MVIADVAEFYAEEGGGVKTYIHQKLAEGSKRGQEVYIVAPGPRDGFEKRRGGTIAWIKSKPLPVDPRYYMLLSKKKVHAVLDEINPDVVEGSSPWTGGWFAAAYPRKVIKSFLFHQDPIAVYPQTFLGSFIGERTVDTLFGGFWAYLRLLSSKFDTTIVSGYWLEEKLRNRGLTNVRTVPFGIDKSFFYPERQSTELKKELLSKCGRSQDARLIITISRHHPEKRLLTLMRAFKKISREENIGLVMFGDGPIRKMIDNYAKRVDGIHIAGFCGDREYLANALASADLLLHGSTAETYGIVIAEAMCLGVPIVVPKGGGAYDLSGPGYAETYKPGNAHECYLAIKRLLERDPEELRSSALQASVSKVMAREDHFSTLFAYYNQLLEQRE